MARAALLLIAIAALAQPARAVTAIGAGGAHTCAITTDGRLACFGAGERGQLGDGTVRSRSSPAAVPGLSGVVEVALGREHTCARTRNGRVHCFGRNDRGQLGDGSRRDRAHPAPVRGLEDARALSAGDDHTCALLAGGGVRCWGANRYGQLGDGSRFAFSPVPVAMTGIEDATAIAAGFAHTCALLAGGEVACTGANFSGQLGDGTRIERRAPVRVVGLEGMGEIAAGEAHTCARRVEDGEGSGARSGEVFCWGAGAGGQLGDEAEIDRPTPKAAPALSPAKGLLLARVFSCGVTDDGLVCVGDRFGRKPRAVPLADVRAWSGGGRHACAVTTSGDAWCLGDNDQGQLGEGSRGGLASTAPLAVPLPAPAIELAIAVDQSCARHADGDVTCWGDGQPLQSAGKRPLAAALDDDPDRLRCRVTKKGRVRCKAGRKWSTVRGFRRALGLTTGERFGCAIVGKKSRVYCWGDAMRGELGDGALVASRKRAKRIPDLSGVTQVEAGRYFACALDDTGHVSCWGAGEKGELGDGALTSRASPAPVPGLDDVVRIAVGDAHACALQKTGEVACWGAFGGGPRSRPAPMAGVDDAVELKSGAAHTCARRETGDVLCWGEGARGQLGQGGRLSSDKPLPVVGLVEPLADRR